MRRLAKKLLAIGLVITLFASLGLNWYLYRMANEYYIDLNATRLDPLGLSAYPPEQHPTPASNKPLVVFFGDSRAANWLAPTQNSRFTFANRGIGAQTTAQVADRYVQHVRPLKPAVVVLQVGINDLKTIPLFPDRRDEIVEHCKQNIQRIVNMAVNDGAQVILTAVFQQGQIPLARRPFWSADVGIAINEVNTFIKSMANADVIVLDANQVLAKDGEIVNAKYSLDFLHVNSAGYEMLNKELEVVLSRL